MPEIRALVVDDEPLARRAVRQLLAPYPDIVVVGECRDGYEALRALVTMAPDLVFLDVEMPGLSGLELIRAHGVERMPVVVFVTAYDEFAVRAFETRALDYLVKPIGEARFRAAISRVRERIHTENAIALAARLTALLAEAPSRSARSGGAETGVRLRRPTGHVAVQSGTGELFLAPNEIDWIEVNDYHVRIHAGGQEYGTRGSLSSLEARLDPALFFRVHRSAIVRLDRVRQLRVDGAGKAATVTLQDDTELQVSRRRVARLKALLRSPVRRS